MPRALLKNARSAIILIVDTNFSESSQMEGRREVGCERTIWRTGKRWGAVEVGTGRSLGKLHATADAGSHMTLSPRRGS